MPKPGSWFRGFVQYAREGPGRAKTPGPPTSVCGDPGGGPKVGRNRNMPWSVFRFRYVASATPGRRLCVRMADKSAYQVGMSAGRRFGPDGRPVGLECPAQAKCAHCAELTPRPARLHAARQHLRTPANPMSSVCPTCRGRGTIRILTADPERKPCPAPAAAEPATTSPQFPGPCAIRLCGPIIATPTP
jgi:hypothetical protein